MDNRVLKSEMVLHGDTIKKLAEYLDLAEQTLSRKINGKADFTQTEMSRIRKRYDLDNETFARIFLKEVESR